MQRDASLTCLGLALTLAFLVLPSPTGASADSAMEKVMPAYDANGRLLLPEGYERWVFVGSSLGLSYSEGAAGMEMFHHTLMEPTAYEHFAKTGEFREGTMLALLLHGLGEGVLPSRQGRFAAEIHAVELAVKDSSRVEETWAYYNFGGMNGLRQAVQPLPAESCQSCHVEHAGYDNVFVQFYPLLVDAAPKGVLPASLPGAMPAIAAQAHMATGATASQSEPSEEDEGNGTGEASEAAAPLALGGLDPVHLVAGREELGKPEIVMQADGYRYQFVSEPSRQAFAEDPKRYSIRNKSCLVVPGAPIDPALVAVHEERIYAFATNRCVEQFNADPWAFLEEKGLE